jgi:hypothetical protein
VVDAKSRARPFLRSWQSVHILIQFSGFANCKFERVRCSFLDNFVPQSSDLHGLFFTCFYSSSWKDFTVFRGDYEFLLFLSRRCCRGSFVLN